MHDTTLLTENQRNKFERNQQICSKFAVLQGAIQERVKVIAAEFGISGSQVRIILKSNKLIGWKKS